MAIEDAIVLGKCLRDESDVPAAFDAYEEERRQRVERVVAHGARTSSNKAGGPIGRVVRDIFLPFVLKRLGSPEAMAWIYDYRIDWDYAPVTERQPA